MTARIEALIVRGSMFLIVVGIMFLIVVLAGCGSTQTKVVYEKVDVPKPFWDPPENVRQLPEPVDLQTDHLTPEAATADPTAALVMVGQDLGLCLGSNELLRHLYLELVKLISEPPPPPAPPPD